MPSPSACSAARSLRTASGHLWRSAAVGGAAAALGLLPLVYVLPAPAWQRTVLGVLCLLYLASKAYRLRAAWQAVRQLRLEGCFIGQSFNGYQLRRCLQRRGHLWTHSYTVRALRRLMAHPLSSLLLTGKKHQRVREEYRRTLEHMQPSRFSVGLPLGVVLVGLVLYSVAGAALPVWSLRAALAASLLVLGTEGVQAACRYRARRLFAGLVDALADWTLARSVHDLLRGRQPSSYRHTPLYRAPAWFAAQAPARPAAAGNAADESMAKPQAA